MTLNEAKQKAYSAAHRAAKQSEIVLANNPPPTLEDACELVQMATELNCAALEIKARLTGVPETKIG